MIVKMNKVAIFGMEDQREALIRSLMDIGAVELSVTDAEEFEDLACNPNLQTELSDMEAKMSDISLALDSLNRHSPKKKAGLFQSRREVSNSELDNVLKNKDVIELAVRNIRDQEEKLVQLKNEENRLDNLISSLLPWKDYSVPLEITGTRETLILPGTIPGSVDLSNVIADLSDKVVYSEINIIGSDKEQHYIFVVCHRDSEQECLSCLKGYGFTKASFAGLSGTTSENIENLQKELLRIDEERAKSIEEIRHYSTERVLLEVLYDGLGMEKARIEAAEKVLKTRKVFLINGWIPEEIAQKAKEHLESSFTLSVSISEPAEDEEFPVLLENRGLAEAGEPVSGMYSLPSSREIDPNAVMTPFYVLFFGLMLSDGGYGLIMALVTGFVLLRFKLEDGTRKFAKLLFFCGIATVFWGAMFGSWFGIEALTKYGIWLNPVEQPELMLSWSLLFGVVHLYAGFAMQAANLIRKKKYLAAFLDVAPRYIFYTGAIAILLPYAPEVDATAVAPLVNIGKYLLIIGAVFMILTQARGNKGVFSKLFGGVFSLYDVVGFMSDILSYSRLLALGLATGIIASIVNQMSVMFDFPAIIKFVLMLLIILVGHSINFAINALGAYVHSCRLQYLEFFGKFFTGGGVAFKPLKANTKYIAVKSDAVM